MYKIWLSVLGAGFSPIAPGTCGSAVVALVFAVAAGMGLQGAGLLCLLILLALHGSIVTVVYGHRFIAQYGPDPGPIVSDEQAGQAISYLWLWNFTGSKEIVAVTLLGFLLFRLFDIVKPPPVRQLERYPQGWGVLLDDLMAGVYAAAALQLLLRTGFLNSLTG